MNKPINSKKKIAFAFYQVKISDLIIAVFI